MRAVAFAKSLPIDAPEALIDIVVERPTPGPRDLLVKVEAVSVNPVDVKVRAGGDPPAPRILGFDAAGTVAAIGRDATLFKPGDAVFYAGSNMRPGTNGEFHLVDERIVGRMPKTLSFADAAALPLTALTAWELFFDRIGIVRRPDLDMRSLLIVGGAGGVGSIAIQIACRLTGLTVIATASRPETVAWVRELGAHHVIDHRQPFAVQLAAIGMPAVDIVASFAGTKSNAAEIVAVVAPEGRIGTIEGATGFGPAETDKMFRKSVGFHFELMFTRSSLATATMIGQHRILDEVAGLVDRGLIRSTRKTTLGPISAASLREAHRLVESGRMIGKVVVEGWPA